MANKYSAEQIDFIRDAAMRMRPNDMISQYAERFGEKLTEGRISYLKKLAGISFNYLDKPLGHNWTEEEREWLRQNVKGITTYELHAKFNEHFGVNLTYQQVRSQKKRLGLSNGLDCTFKIGHTGYPRGVNYQHYFTKEQLQFIQDNVWNSNIELARKFNEKFGTNLPPHKMYGAKHRHGIKGAPHGVHGTQFYSGYMKGKVSPRREEAGTKKLWGIKNPTPKCKTDTGEWDSPGRVTWRKVHGEIPEGYMIRYLDGNPFNNAIENLELVTRSENAMINAKRLFGENPELSKTGLLIAQVMSAAYRKKKDLGKAE